MKIISMKIMILLVDPEVWNENWYFESDKRGIFGAMKAI